MWRGLKTNAVCFGEKYNMTCCVQDSDHRDAGSIDNDDEHQSLLHNDGKTWSQIVILIMTTASWVFFTYFCLRPFYSLAAHRPLMTPFLQTLFLTYVFSCFHLHPAFAMPGSTSECHLFVGLTLFLLS